VAAVALVLLLGAIVVLGAGQLLHRPTPPTLETRGADVFAPTCAHPAGLTVVAEAIWVSCVDQVRRFDPTGAVTGAVPATALAVDAAGAWIAASGGVRSLDPATFAVGPPLRLPNVTALALDDTAVWALQPAEKTLVRIGRATSVQTGSLTFSSRPAGVAVGAGRVWVLLPDEDRVAVVDADTIAVLADVAVRDPVAAVASSCAVWIVAGSPTTSVIRIDPGSLATDELPLPASADGGLPGIAAFDGAIWAIDGSRLSDIDPVNRAVIAVVDVRAPSPATLGAAASVGGQLLVIDTTGDRLLRVRPGT